MTLDDSMAARAWLVFACRDHAGRFQGDPVFEAVTEGRQHGTYSACADLAHWLLFRMGVRFAWLNRAEFRGWLPVVNLRRLTAVQAGGSNTIARLPVYGERLNPGDVLVLETHEPARSHVMVIAAPCELRAGELWSAEYGQFSDLARRPSGALCDRTVALAPLRVGARKVDSVLHLVDVLASADTSGLFAEPDSLTDYAARKNHRRTLRHIDPAMTGDDVGTVERATGADVDYLFGPKTEKAVRAFQLSHGLSVDGVVGPKTWAAIG